MRKFKKRVLAFSLCAVTLFTSLSTAYADGDGKTDIPASAEAVEAQCSGEYACLVEASTGEVLASKNSTNPFHMGHLAKLMTIYLTAQQIRSGEITLETQVTASSQANSQGGTQIWLNAGETITVEELLKSISIGNANDACYALSEALFKTDDTYINKANETAVSLGMENTHFADITGMNEQSVTTAEDIAVLASEISKYEFLNQYFCTWMDNVRGGQTELVNTNRLVRSYNGITGMKACHDESSKNCVVATAKRNGMTLVSVVAGCDDADERFSDAENMLDYGFSAYELYTPEIPEKAVAKIKVTNGSQQKVSVAVSDNSQVLIGRGRSGNITAVFERDESLAAPVKKGQVVGNLRLLDGEGVVFETKIVTSENVSKMTVGLALKRLWLNLLNFG